MRERGTRAQPHDHGSLRAHSTAAAGLLLPYHSRVVKQNQDQNRKPSEQSA